MVCHRSNVYTLACYIELWEDEEMMAVAGCLWTVGVLQDRGSVVNCSGGSADKTIISYVATLDEK